MFWQRNLLSGMENLPFPLFEEGFGSNIDWQAWEKISREQGSFIYIPQQLMGHRIHEESTTTALIENNERGREDFAMLRRFWPSWIASLIGKFYARAEDSNQRG